MGSFGDKELCPRCGGARLRTWDELTDEQKFLVERLPASAEFTKPERKESPYMFVNCKAAPNIIEKIKNNAIL